MNLKIVFSISVTGASLTACMNSFGGSPSGAILDRIKASPQFHENKFDNSPHVDNIVAGKYFEMLRREIFGNETRIPPKQLKIQNPDPKLFPDTPVAGLRAVWFGHAAVMIEIDGVRIFTDPYLSDRASPFESIGPQRFFQPPIPLESLPHIDAVVISHDHYDHLDMTTTKFLAQKGTKFFVPLGIGSHLRVWGVPEEQITELDWWEKARIKSIDLVCTPAIHYSGRNISGGNQTLWSSWSIIGPQHRVFHSGDSGFGNHFAEIGAKYGPFDTAFIKIGAYDVTWLNIHMDPEQAMAANVALRGRRMFPIHWGTINLQVHNWDEPILRAKVAAASQKQDLVTPTPGEIFDADKPFTSHDWWLD